MKHGLIWMHLAILYVCILLLVYVGLSMNQELASLQAEQQKTFGHINGLIAKTTATRLKVDCLEKRLPPDANQVWDAPQISSYLK